MLLIVDRFIYNKQVQLSVHISRPNLHCKLFQDNFYILLATTGRHRPLAATICYRPLWAATGPYRPLPTPTGPYWPLPAPTGTT